MKLIIAAPANGTELKNALHAQLAADSRISELRDMSTDASYPQISFAVARAIAASAAQALAPPSPPTKSQASAPPPPTI